MESHAHGSNLIYYLIGESTMKVYKPLFQFMAAYLIAALGLLLIATALFLPPMGVIDPTGPDSLR